MLISCALNHKEDARKFILPVDERFLCTCIEKCPGALKSFLRFDVDAHVSI